MNFESQFLNHLNFQIYFEGLRRTDIIPFVCYISHIGFYTIQWIYADAGQLFDWSLSQAESGNLNREYLDGVYDANDYHKFYKATALFSMGMVCTLLISCVLIK